MNERSSKVYIAKTREEDINIRGKRHEVYDYDGHIVTLENAKVWYNNEGNYVEPITYQRIECTTCTIM